MPKALEGVNAGPFAAYDGRGEPTAALSAGVCGRSVWAVRRATVRERRPTSLGPRAALLHTQCCSARRRLP